jgi:ribosomal-protein-alanine N-acetyltransferase
MNAAAQRPRSRYVPSVVSGDRVVGLIDLSIRSRPLGAAEFGYAVHDCWGQGIATAAGRLATDHAFRSLGIRTIHATCDATNIASVRVLEKLGMRPDATLRRHIWLGDRWRDTHVFSLPAPQDPPPASDAEGPSKRAGRSSARGCARPRGLQSQQVSAPRRDGSRAGCAPPSGTSAEAHRLGGGSHKTALRWVDRSPSRDQVHRDPTRIFLGLAHRRAL